MSVDVAQDDRGVGVLCEWSDIWFVVVWTRRGRWYVDVVKVYVCLEMECDGLDLHWSWHVRWCDGCVFDCLVNEEEKAASLPSCRAVFPQCSVVWDGWCG